MPEKRRILIVDANPPLRRGLAALIGAEPDLAVCAEAATAQEALDAIAAAGPFSNATPPRAAAAAAPRSAARRERER